MNNIVCFLIDGLHSGFPGAYGNSEGLTPAFDSLASESVLFDQYFVNTMDLAHVYEGFWNAMDPAEKDPVSLNALPGILKDRNYRTVLLTNDSTIANLEAASAFEEILVIDEKNSDNPESLEDSPLYSIFSQWGSKILKMNRSADDRPFLIWCHLKEFYAPWNIPESWLQENAEKNSSDQFQADDLFEKRRKRYKIAVRLLDDLLAGLLDVFDQYDLWDDLIFLLGSSRGYNFQKPDLLENEVSESKVSKNETFDLVPDEIHLPLLIRFPDQKFASVRVGGLCQPADLYHTLACEYHERSEDLPGLFPLMNETKDQIHEWIRVVEKDPQSLKRALITDQWFFKIFKDVNGDPGQKFELYVRPDDRWCVNEVAGRCADIVEELNRQWTERE